MDVRLFAFIGIAALITITPGADMALVTRVALGQGQRAAWLTSCGIVAGLLVWGMASAIGISAVLTASATLYALLKLAGAIYLIILGVQALVARVPAHDDPMPAMPPHASRFRLLGRGLLNNLLNPKIGVFYTAFLPQFIAPGQPVFLLSLLLAAIHAVLGILWLLLYATMVTKAGALFRRPQVRRALERITGIVLIGFGVRLATEPR
jgi:threonine/homoserine/homoserine lactone efflux protein